MSGGIYLISDTGELVEMRESLYDSEDLLQELIAKYPNLLAGDQINNISPRRWLLITREASIPREEGGSSWLSLDHLFLDQDGIPTLVEVKRSTDTRIRREVVGQMLDYAANAVAYWPVEELVTKFEQSCERRNDNPDQKIADFLEVEPGDQKINEYWGLVKTNIQAGKIRMVFVSDKIPRELQRVIEFLNNQMDPAEVLALEIKQYSGQNLKTLVPRIIGQTAEAQNKKTRNMTEKRQWDEDTFFEEIQKGGQEVAWVAKQIYEWASTHPSMNRIWWGQGTSYGSFVPIVRHKNVDHQLFSVHTTGCIEMYFHYYQRKVPFDSEKLRLELLDKLNAFPGVSLPVEAISKMPKVPLDPFTSKEELKELLSVFNWIVEEIISS